ncbi:hypothetical protein F4825DRAFT_436039 [Nemania diffusa]|nr:hypothetical protein F4825DRAFT_436039 [Nemania diffusa]
MMFDMSEKMMFMQCNSHHIYRDIVFLTLLFIATGLPSSYSMPASPPSPAMPDIFRRSSSSCCAIVFFYIRIGVIMTVVVLRDAGGCEVMGPWRGWVCAGESSADGDGALKEVAYAILYPDRS